MTQNGLLIAEGLLEQCQAWQEVIDSQNSSGDKDAAAKEARVRITPPDTEPSMLVHGENAIVTAADSLTSRSSDEALEFSEVIVRGALDYIGYLRFKSGDGFLTWVVKGPEVKNAREVSVEEALTELDDPSQPTMPVDRELYLPVHFPVSGIKGVMFAGRNQYRLSERFYQYAA